MSGLIRVFPRRTCATPTDDRAFVGDPPMFLEAADVGEVHVSCAFTWDLPRAERLARSWAWTFPGAKVRTGGPAYGDPGGDFEPGLYLKPGYLITSRGCPNRCERCRVPDREGPLRTIPITGGWDVVDNNLLACPTEHIDKVLAMLSRQPHKARFTGGLEAARFTNEIAYRLLALRPRFQVVFFAYDRPQDKVQLGRAFGIIRELTGWSAGMMRHRVSCYVLVGFGGDTIADAERRCAWVIGQDVRAFPMYYRDENYSRQTPDWHDLVGGMMAFGGKGSR